VTIEVVQALPVPRPAEGSIVEIPGGRPRRLEVVRVHEIKGIERWGVAFTAWMVSASQCRYLATYMLDGSVTVDRAMWWHEPWDGPMSDTLFVAAQALEEGAISDADYEAIAKDPSRAEEVDDFAAWLAEQVQQ
jgi:hypothetical protein